MKRAQTREEKLVAAVRRVLSRKVYDFRKPDEIDREYLDLAAAAMAAVFVLDATMKRSGRLLPHQADAYVAACRHRDAALFALKIPDPYRKAREKLT